LGNKLALFDLWNHRYKSFFHAAKKNYPAYALRHFRIREYIAAQSRELRFDIVSAVIYGVNSLKIDLHTSRPGLVLGKAGANINSMRAKLAKITNLPLDDININLVPVNKPELNANLIALRVAQDLERRKSYNSSMKSHAEDAMRFGALGVRIQCSGRLNGVEIARTATVSKGKVPRQNIRANVYYAGETAFTNSGTCGTKVWINLPTTLPNKKSHDADRPSRPHHSKRPGSGSRPPFGPRTGSDRANSERISPTQTEAVQSARAETMKEGVE